MTSLQDFDMAGFERHLRNKICNELHHEAVSAMKSNEYNFNDTAVRAKALFYASQLVKDGK
jgi:hypothetical protein